MEPMNGQMDLSIQDTGRMTRLVDMVKRIMQMEMFMKGIGRMVWLMDRGNIQKRTGLIIKDSGRIICLMEKERKYQEKKILFSRAYFSKERNKDQVLIGSLIQVNTKESLITTLQMVQEYLNGRMVKFTKETGFKIRCLAKEK